MVNYENLFPNALRKMKAKLSYPEGQATAKVLQVGENSRFKNTIEAKHDLSLMISASLIELY